MSHIRILCTARSAQVDELQPAVTLLESWGHQVTLGNSIGKVHHQMGGTISQRIADFQEALEDDSIDYIWIARGGYGSVQIMDGIDFFTRSLSRKRHPKTLIGYSDVTYLHARWTQLGWKSIHAFMPLEIATRSDQSITSLQKALSGESLHTQIPNIDQLADQHITGTLVGGNLSILFALLGSADFPDTSNCILFIEDIDEYLYHIERMMYSLKRAGALSHLKALVVGGMTSMNDHEIPFGKNAIQIITDITSCYDYPVVFNFPTGHIKDHRSLLLNEKADLKISRQHITLTQTHGNS